MTRFSLGQVVMTTGALAELYTEEVKIALKRHSMGDWGMAPPEDKAENETALKEGYRLMSVYRSRRGGEFWIITEADRSSTLVLLPSEY